MEAGDFVKDVEDVVPSPAKFAERCIDGYKIIEYEKSNIFVVEDIFDDALCKEFCKLIDTLPSKKMIYCPGNNVKCHISHINELLNTKDDLFYAFSTDSTEYAKMLDNVANPAKNIQTNLMNGVTHDTVVEYNEKINKKMKKVAELMKEINKHIKFDHNSGYILRKIYGSTRLHVDGINEIYNSDINFIHNNKFGDYKMIRNATIIIALNEDYDGGLYNFPYYGVSLRLKKGSVLIFPPFWTHEHEATELMNNTIKYTITTWTCMKI